MLRSSKAAGIISLLIAVLVAAVVIKIRADRNNPSALDEETSNLPASRLCFTDPGPPQQNEHVPLRIPEQVEVTVLNEQRQPQEGAGVKFIFQPVIDSPPLEIEGVSDAKGQIVFDFADVRKQKIRELEYLISMPGYLKQRERRIWYHRTTDDFPAIPKEIQIFLDPGKQLSGRVVDEDGKPLANVKAMVKTRLSDIFELTTDENGIWTTPLVQSNASVYQLKLSLSGYVPLAINIATDHRETVLKRGRTFRGTVLDTSGDPIAGVKILWRYINDPYETVTDENGRFAIAGLAPGIHYFTFHAEKAASSLQKIDLSKADQDSVVTLEPGSDLKIRIVDEDGNALPDVSIHCPELRSYSFMPHVSDHRAEGGAWIWHRAPEKPLAIVFYWDHYDIWRKNEEKKWNNLQILDHFATCYQNTEENMEFIPREEEYVVVMKRADYEPEQPTDLVIPETMTLRLLDQKGKPVAGAEIQANIVFIGNEHISVPYVSQKALTDAKGGCVIDFDRVNRKAVYSFSMNIKASDETFMPISTYWANSFGRGRRIRVKNREPKIPEEWEIRMIRYDSLTGKVVDENGKPLADVKVGIESPDSVQFREQLQTPWFPASWDHRMSDAEGKWHTNKFYPDPTRSKSREQKLVFSKPGYAKLELPIKDFSNRPVHLQREQLRESKKVLIDVRDEDGYPVDHVRLRCNKTFVYQQLPTWEYVYTMDNPNADSVEIVVMTDRHTPQIRTVKLEEKETRVEFRMERGKRMRIRAVDQHGDPVPFLRISQVKWQWDDQQREWLHGSYLEFDSEGTLDWNNAPDIEAEYSFDPSYMYSPRNRQRTWTLKPREEEHVLELERRK